MEDLWVIMIISPGFNMESANYLANAPTANRPRLPTTARAGSLRMEPCSMNRTRNQSRALENDDPLLQDPSLPGEQLHLLRLNRTEQSRPDSNERQRGSNHKDEQPGHEINETVRDDPNSYRPGWCTQHLQVERTKNTIQIPKVSKGQSSCLVFTPPHRTVTYSMACEAPSPLTPLSMHVFRPTATK